MRFNLVILTTVIGVLQGATPEYNVAAIVTPPDWTGVGLSGLNNLGQVAGYGMPNGIISQAFIASTSIATPIPQPAGFSVATVSGINDTGLISGRGATGAGPLQDFLATIQGITFIPVTNINIFTLSAPNNSGQVAAACAPVGSPYFLPYVAAASGVTLVPLPSGFASSASVETCCFINNSGQVAGTGFGTPSTQIFIGTPAGSSAFTLPLSWSLMSLNGFNDSGHVTGSARIAGNVQAFLGTPSGSVAIQLPGGANFGQPSAMNESDVVVGDSESGSWIWDSVHQARLLNNLVPVGWNVQNPIAINNPGQILAQATSPQGVDEYVLLTPTGLPATPAPGTLGLTIAGLALLALLLWRRAATSSSAA